MTTLLQYQLQHGIFIPLAIANIMDRYSPEPDVVAGFGSLAREPESQFFVVESETEESELDAWRRGVEGGDRLRSEDLDQALEEAALSPISPFYGPWDTTNQIYPALPQTPLPFVAMDGQEQHPDYYQQHPNQQQQYYAPASSSSQHQGFVPIYTHHQAPVTQPSYSAYPESSSSSPQGQYPTSEGDAEADLKRLRNTAASARFRAKKKQREQSLEQQAREKKQALEKLENRIRELEQENKFLKGLIMGPRDEELKALKKQRDEVIESDRKGFEHKDGVGTD